MANIIHSFGTTAWNFLASLPSSPRALCSAVTNFFHCKAPEAASLDPKRVALVNPEEDEIELSPPSAASSSHEVPPAPLTFPDYVPPPPALKQEEPAAPPKSEFPDASAFGPPPSEPILPSPAPPKWPLFDDPKQKLAANLEQHRLTWQAICGQKDLGPIGTDLEHLDRVLIYWNHLDQISLWDKEANQLRTLRLGAAELLNHPAAESAKQGTLHLNAEKLVFENGAQQKIAHQILHLSEEQGISVPLAAQKVYADLHNFVEEIDQRLSEIIRLKKECTKTLLEKEDEMAGIGRIHLALGRQAAQGPQAPASFLDRFTCYHDGDNLLQRKGYFLTADFLKVPACDLAAAKAAMNEETMRALLKAAPTNIFLRYKVVEGQLKADPKGNILLSKQSVKETLAAKVEADFGTRQRLLKVGDQLQLENKLPKESASLTAWGRGHERLRTAGTDAAQSALIMKALTEKTLTGQTADIDFNELNDTLGYLDAVAANDLAKLPGSYLSQPDYTTRRALLQKIRPFLCHSVFAHAARASGTDLVEKYDYNWKKDLHRVFLLEEFYRKIILSLIDHEAKFLLGENGQPGALHNQDAAEKLGPFIRGLKSLAIDAGRTGAKLRRAFPDLGKPFTTPEERKRAHIYLQQHESEIIEALSNLNHEMSLQRTQAIDLSIGLKSPAFQKKLNEFFGIIEEGSKLFRCFCADKRAKRSAALKQIGAALTNSLTKSQTQIPSHTSLIMKELFNGTSYKPALLKTLRLFEAQKHSFMNQQVEQSARSFALQSEHGLRGVEQFVGH